MIKESVNFQSAGLGIEGELYLPGNQGPYPGVCICHGIPADTQAAATDIKDRGYAEVAKKFCDEGFMALIFNFRGTGNSQGNFDILGWTEDLKAALDYFWARPELDRASLALLGFSGGAAVSVYVAAEDDRVRSVVAAACPADFGEIMAENTPEEMIERFRNIGIIRDEAFPPSVPGWMDNFREVNPVDRVAGISPRALLVLHGSEDKVVPASHARMLYRAAQDPKNILIIHGAGHRLRQDENAMKTATVWLKRRARAVGQKTDQAE